MYYANLQVHELPVKDVLDLAEEIEDLRDEEREIMVSAVAEGVAKVIEQLEFK